MKFRPHRRLLAESMAEVVELASTKKALASYYNKTVRSGPALTADKIELRPYGFDDRIGWNAYLVTAEGFGLIGFTDQPTSK
jgi:hypothetical protein